MLLGMARRLTGLLGIALLWAAIWCAMFLALGLGILVFDPPSIDAGEEPWRIALLYGAPFGMLSGAVFAIILVLAEGGKSLRSIPAVRWLAWSVAAASVVPLAVLKFDALLVFWPIGLVCGAMLLALVRRAESAHSPLHSIGRLVATPFEAVVGR